MENNINSKEMVKIIVGVPETHAEKIREALGKAGVGRIGNYDFCSFSVKGTGRFRPQKGANPAIGQIGKLEEVAEEQIQTVCYRSDLEGTIKAVKEAHPYEEPAIDIIPLISS